MATWWSLRPRLSWGILLVPVGILLLQLVWGVFSKKTGHKSLVRSSSTIPILENTIEFVGQIRRGHDWNVEICREAQGRPILIKSIGQPQIVTISTPEAIEEVLKTQFDAFPKGEQQCDILGGILGDGIFAVDGAKWVHQRKIASNLFTAKSLRDIMTTKMRKHTDVLLRILNQAEQGDQTIDLFKLMNRFTIEAFCEIGFGVDLGCLGAEEEHPFQSAFDSAQRMLVLRFILSSWIWKTQRLLGIGTEGQLKRDLKLIDETVMDIIAESLQQRKDNNRTRKDVNLVTLFLDHIENSSDAEGRDTTAQALGSSSRSLATPKWL